MTDATQDDDQDSPSERIPDRRRRLYTDARSSWGLEAQINKAAEEFSELAAALNRDLNGQQDPDELLNEMEDARLMLEQLEHSLYSSESVDAAVQEATDDLVARLEEHGKTEEVSCDD
jgi:hypothetical protein